MFACDPVWGKAVETNDGAVVLKYLADGTLDWSHVGNTSMVLAYKVYVDGAGDIFVIGFGNNELVVNKYDNSGVLLWESPSVPAFHWNSIGAERIDIHFPEDGYFYVACKSWGIESDLLAVKYNALTGNVEWSQTYNNAAYNDSWDVARSITTDEADNVYVAGEA